MSEEILEIKFTGYVASKIREYQRITTEAYKKYREALDSGKDYIESRHDYISKAAVLGMLIIEALDDEE